MKMTQAEIREALILFGQILNPIVAGKSYDESVQTFAQMHNVEPFIVQELIANELDSVLDDNALRSKRFKRDAQSADSEAQ